MVLKPIRRITVVLIGLMATSATLAADNFTGTYTTDNAVTSETLAQCLVTVDLAVGSNTVEFALMHLTASDNAEPASPAIGPMSLDGDTVVQLNEIITVPVEEITRWEEGTAGPRLLIEYLGADGEMVVEYVGLVSVDAGEGEAQ